MKKAVIIASFGTAYAKTRHNTLDKIEDEARNLFADAEIVSAYTSSIVRNILKSRDNITVFSPLEAAQTLKKRGFTKIYIQPTHVIAGFEFDKLHIDGCILSLPLLHSRCDLKKIIEALELQPARDGEAVVFMGHGTDHAADAFYCKLEKEMHTLGFINTFLRTVEGSYTVFELLPILKQRGIRRVTLLPFMTVAGDHAENNMAGDDEKSWKSILQNEGFSVNAVIRGLGENPKIRAIMYSALKTAMEEYP